MTSDRLVPWLLLMLLVGLPVLVQAEQAMPEIRPRGGQANQPVELLLRRTVSMELRNVPLGEVIDQFRKASGANIVVTWNVLQQYGITRDQEVNLPPVKDLPVEKVLELVLDQVSASLGGITRLAWTIQGNVVLVSTRDALAESLSIRIYDVGDLMDMIGSSRPDTPRDAGAADKLMDTIMATVEPESWTNTGGKASIRLLNDQLVINQGPLAQEAIARLLQDLRKSALEANPLWRPVSAEFQEALLKTVLEQLTHQAKADL
jgi:hypothetical protein